MQRPHAALQMGSWQIGQSAADMGNEVLGYATRNRPTVEVLPLGSPGKLGSAHIATNDDCGLTGQPFCWTK